MLQCPAHEHRVLSSAPLPKKKLTETLDDANLGGKMLSHAMEKFQWETVCNIAKWKT